MGEPRETPRSAVVADLAQRLRARGLRMTPQREQVLLVVRELGHATPEQIADALTGDVEVSTVYRTLELLEELDLVRHTHLGHGAPSYRPADDDHLHIVCHTCQCVIDAPDELERAVDALEVRLLVDRDFELDRAHFTVFGRCGACRANAEREQHAAVER